MNLFRERGTEHPTSPWNRIDWNAVTETVRQIQTRLVKALEQGNLGHAKKLQRLLVNSTAAKLLAVRQVVSNRGKSTPGIDGVVWKTPQAKYHAAMKLPPKGYTALPLRRVYIPKANGRRRKLGIPVWSEKLLEEVMRMILEAYDEPQFQESSHGFRPNRGCHTALSEIMRTWTGTKWFIETDIKGVSTIYPTPGC